MIGVGAFFIFWIFQYQLREPQHTFDLSFKHAASVQVYKGSTSIKILENDDFTEIIPKLQNYTHYLFVKHPSLLCLKSVSRLIDKLPKCSIYTKLHFNTMPREYYNKLYKEQQPYLDYVFSTSFTLIDSCIVSQLTKLRLYSFSFLHHLSLYSIIFNWYIYNDQHFLAFHLDSPDICNFYLYSYPAKNPGLEVDNTTSISVSLNKPLYSVF